MSSILITGATGTVGRQVAHALIKQGVAFRIATRHPEPGNTQEVYLDFLQPETAFTALKGVEKIFLMRPPQIGDAKTYFQPFVQAAQQQGVTQIVFLSVMGVEHLPFAPHAQIEHYIREAGIACTSLRPSFFMQNLVTEHLDEIRQDRTLYIPAGDAKTSLIDARDIGEAAAVSLLDDQQRNKAYTLTGSEALTYYEVAQVMTEELGHAFTYANPSEEQFRAHLQAKGLPAPYIDNVLTVYGIARSGIAAAVTSDVATLLGRPPKTVREFVRDYRSYF